MDIRMLYEAHLMLALKHVANGRTRVRRQIAIVRRLRAEGLDCSLSLEILRVLRKSLAVDRDHRDLLQRICWRR